ncbi:MAG: hypothetical protein LC746_00995 [Acidobacteria bacterium]|nr:hypothetical protein [Acidobacteriota bacterium]
MTEHSGDLERRVSELEHKLDLLIRNLGANNGDLLRLTLELLDYVDLPGGKGDDFRHDFQVAYCDRQPPKCGQ